jgi:hypothetical protein
MAKSPAAPSGPINQHKRMAMGKPIPGNERKGPLPPK